MNTTLAASFFPAMKVFGQTPRKERFRQQFQCSLRSCVTRGFSVEESFGMIWVETWEEVSLTEQEQAELYDELLKWAKTAHFE